MALRCVRILLFLTICLLILLPVTGVSQNQSKDDKKIKTAVERSKKATEVLKQVIALPEGKGIPKEISEKMNLIGVVPDVFQISLLFSKGFRGYGVASVRRDDGWSLPSYYFFGQANGFDLTGIGSKHFDIIMVVVNARTERKKKEDKAKTIPTDKKDKSDERRSYIYAFADGVLSPIKLRTGFLAALSGATTNVIYDDSLNKVIYGAKGDDILGGKIDETKQVPSEVPAFREILDQAYPGKKAAHPPEVYEDSDAYAIYSVLIETEWPVRVAKAKQLVIQADTSVYPRSGGSDERICLVPAKGEEATYEPLLAAYRELNKTKYLLQPKFNTSVPFELVSKASIMAMFAEDGIGGWKDFYQKYPDSGGYISMSAVAFSTDRTIAMVYLDHHCGGLCGGGGYHFLKKTDGKWHEFPWPGMSCSWIS